MLSVFQSRCLDPVFQFWLMSPDGSRSSGTSCLSPSREASSHTTPSIYTLWTPAAPQPVSSSHLYECGGLWFLSKHHLESLFLTRATVSCVCFYNPPRSGYRFQASAHVWELIHAVLCMLCVSTSSAVTQWKVQRLASHRYPVHQQGFYTSRFQ